MQNWYRHSINYFLTRTLMPTMIDKALVAGSDLALDSNGDFITVSENYSILQTVQNRCIAVLGSWIYDSEFGTSIYEFIKSNSIEAITDDLMLSTVELAIKDMIDDGRVTELRYAKILEKTDDAIFVEIGVVI